MPNCFTYRGGDFGIIDLSQYDSLLDDVAALTLALHSNDVVIALQSNLEKFSLKPQEEYHLDNVSWSTGLCCDTLLTTRKFRVHCHLFLKARP